jgi:poly(hydroxyalkanoate) granule-associated protein
MPTNVETLQEELKQTAGNAVTLARNTAESVQQDLMGAAGDVRDAVSKIFLAGLGALVMAEEEGSKLFKKLVRKGEKIDLKGLGTEPLRRVRAQLDAQTGRASEAVKGRVEDARYFAGEAVGKAEDRLQDAVAAVIKRVGVPTRDEVAELTASVERLTQHIERLKEERAVAAKPALNVEAVGGGWYEIRVGDVVVEKVQGRDEAEAALARLAAQQN